MESVIDGLDALIAEAKERRGEADKVLAALTRAKTTLGGEPAVESLGKARSDKGKRRRRVGGTRREQALRLVADEPGITAAGIAQTMKINPNYLYRVLGDLEKDGTVKKDGRSYYPQPQAA